jgi:hypothetical protein
MEVDDNDTDPLRDAVQNMHGGTATLAQTVPVRQTFDGKPRMGRRGARFDLAGHPTAINARTASFAGYPTGGWCRTAKNRRFVLPSRIRRFYFEKKRCEEQFPGACQTAWEAWRGGTWVRTKLGRALTRSHHSTSRSW